jgi:hypothetical protein
MSLRLHHLLKHAVIRMPIAIVAHSGANIFRNRIEVAQQFFNLFDCRFGYLSKAAARFLT